MAEAQAEAKGSEESLEDLLKYIEARTRDLSNYSDKLRKALVSFSKVFGHKDECRVCGEERRFHDQASRRQFPNIRLEEHMFLPKIEVSINVRGDVFYTDEDIWGTRDWKLAIEDKQLVLTPWLGGRETHGFVPLEEAPRRVLKELVKTNAIRKFLELVKTRLDTETAVYKEVAELAERIASVSPSP